MPLLYACERRRQKILQLSFGARDSAYALGVSGTAAWPLNRGFSRVKTLGDGTKTVDTTRESRTSRSARTRYAENVTRARGDNRTRTINGVRVTHKGKFAFVLELEEHANAACAYVLRTAMTALNSENKNAVRPAVGGRVSIGLRDLGDDGGFFVRSRVFFFFYRVIAPLYDTRTIGRNTPREPSA